MSAGNPSIPPTYPLSSSVACTATSDAHASGVVEPPRWAEQEQMDWPLPFAACELIEWLQEAHASTPVGQCPSSESKPDKPPKSILVKVPRATDENSPPRQANAVRFSDVKQVRELLSISSAADFRGATSGTCVLPDQQALGPVYIEVLGSVEEDRSCPARPIRPMASPRQSETDASVSFKSSTRGRQRHTDVSDWVEDVYLSNALDGKSEDRVVYDTKGAV